MCETVPGGRPEEVHKVSDVKEAGLKIKTAMCTAELPYGPAHGLVLIGYMIHSRPELPAASGRKFWSPWTQRIILLRASA